MAKILLTSGAIVEIPDSNVHNFIRVNGDLIASVDGISTAKKTSTPSDAELVALKKENEALKETLEELNESIDEVQSATKSKTKKK